MRHEMPVPTFNERGVITRADWGAPLHAEDATSEEDRCKCRGYDILVARPGEDPDGPAMADSGVCRCLRKLTGEDLRCDICRVWCWPDATPRIMSNAAREAIARG